jgi:hypothetical protein
MELGRAAGVPAGGVRALLLLTEGLAGIGCRTQGCICALGCARLRVMRCLARLRVGGAGGHVGLAVLSSLSE